MNNFSFKIKNSRIYSYFVLVLRNFRTKGKFKKTQSKTNFQFSKGKFILGLIITLLLGFILFNFSRYSQIQVTPYLTQENLTGRPLVLSDATELNTLFIGFDDTKNSFKFIDMIAIISVDYKSSSLKIYTLNPNFLVNINNNNVTLRTAFNVLTSTNESKMNDLMSLVENKSAIRIDRYVAFNYSNINEILQVNNFTVESDQSYKLDSIFIAKNEKVYGDKLAKFATYSEQIDDTVLNRQQIFLKAFFENLRDDFNLYKIFLDGSKLNNILFSNFTKEEYIRFILNVANTENFIRTNFASQKLTLDDLTKQNLENGVSFSDMLLDENTSTLFRSIPIIKEQTKIEVFNATDQSGVAYNLKRKFENVGITVIKTGNFPDKLDKNILYIPKNNPDNYINTIRFVRSILRDEVEVVYDNYKFNYSGDMILVIGKQ